MEIPAAAQPMFVGQFRHAMDAKNRVTIPARWRRGEIDEFFAIPDLDGGFLTIMPPEVMKGVAEKVEQDLRFTPQERRDFIRQFYSRAQHLASDKAGRIVIPEEQCNLLQLQGEVVLVGSHSRFEVWNPLTWGRKLEDGTPRFKHMREAFGI
jgi:MraZ protein